MAYGLKYELFCTTRKGNLYKAKILFDGYEGDPIDRNIPLSPFLLKKDKAAIVRGTSFDFSIREAEDFEFLEFYTNNSKKIKVELYDPGDNLIWTGFNLPQQYQAPYVPPPVSITFTASDGLGLLKNEPFLMYGESDPDDIYTEDQLSILRYCIDKIELRLGYSIAINLFEITHNHSITPLAQTYEDINIFQGLSCYEVIENILGKYRAEITQWNGRWQITSAPDKKSTRMLYTSTGHYEGTEAAPAVLNLNLPNAEGVDVYPRGKLNLAMEPGGKKIKFSRMLGRKDSMLLNAGFTDFSEQSGFNSWDVDNTGIEVEQRFDKDWKPYLFIPGYQRGSQNGIYQSIEVQSAPAQNFILEVTCAAFGYKLVGGWKVSFPMTIRLLVMTYDGVDTKYLTKRGWSSDEGTFDFVVGSTIKGVYAPQISESAAKPGFNIFKIISDQLPFISRRTDNLGTLTIKLLKYVEEFNTAGEGDPGYHPVGVGFKQINILNLLVDGRVYPGSIQMQASFPNSSEPTDLPDIDIKSADPPDIPNAIRIYKNFTRLADGSPTTL